MHNIEVMHPECLTCKTIVPTQSTIFRLSAYHFFVFFCYLHQYFIESFIVYVYDAIWST